MIQEPFTSCSRCRRLKLECKIDSNFKRIGKRSRNAEMERELAELRVQIANMTAANESLKAQLESVKRGSNSESAGGGDGGRASAASLSTDHLTGPSHEAVTSLLDLRAGFDGSGYMKNGNQFKRIEDVVLAADRISDLFNLWVNLEHWWEGAQLIDVKKGSLPSTILFFPSWTVTSRRTSTTRRLPCCSG